MGKLNFQSLPVNGMVGARWNTFNEIANKQTVDPKFKKKYLLTKMLCRFLSLLHPLDDARYNKKLRNKKIEIDPVFILGHWRSGTTFVHNVLSQDNHFGYNTTYQTVFPNLMLFGQSFFKKKMAASMPSKRPTDNMELYVDQPQEEEFALGNMSPECFYNFWFFPKATEEYSQKYLLFNQASQEELNKFKSTFERLIKVALWNTNGSQFLSKNPPHTGRIPQILEMFPNAKFIYLMRNPYTVFESTRSFFTNTMESIKLQDISPDQLEENILRVYKDLYFKYENDKHLIPKENLIEIKFEDFEKDAYNCTKEIYEKLQIPNYKNAEPAIRTYLDKKKGYKKNKYQYEQRTIDLVNKYWKFALDQWDYTL